MKRMIWSTLLLPSSLRCKSWRFGTMSLEALPVRFTEPLARPWTLI